MLSSRRLGLLLVVAYFAHAIGSVVYASTLDDAKGQAIWLAMPLLLTPTALYDLLPPLVSPDPKLTWHIALLVRYPIAMAFSATLLFWSGVLLEQLWRKSIASGIGVGVFVGTGFSLLWFFITRGHYAYLWLALIPVAGYCAYGLHPHRHTRRNKA